MAIGGNKNGHGACYFFRSQSLEKWEYAGMLAFPELKGALECPDIFEQDGRFAIMAGSTGAGAGNGRWYLYDAAPPDGGRLVASGHTDRGSAFYAAQSFEHDGRRIQHAWARDGRPGTKKYGFAGLMNLPREVTIENDALCFAPVREVWDYFQRDDAGALFAGCAKRCFCAKMRVCGGGCVVIQLLKSKGKDGLEIVLDFEKDSLRYSENGSIRAETALREQAGADAVDVQIIVDRCIAEVFVGKRTVFSYLNYEEGEAKSQITASGGAAVECEFFSPR